MTKHEQTLWRLIKNESMRLKHYWQYQDKEELIAMAEHYGFNKEMTNDLK